MYFVSREFELWRLKNEQDVEVLRQACGGADTVFDGEVVFEQEQKRYEYLLFDCVCFRGTSVAQEALDKRLASVVEFVGKVRDRTQHVKLNSKTMRPAKDVLKIVRNISKHDSEYLYREHRSQGWRSNGNDGLIFTPHDEPYMCQGDTLLKWKPTELCTVDFSVYRQDIERGNLALYAWTGRNSGPRDGIAVKTVQLYPEQQNEWCGLFVGNREQIVVEMAYDSANSCWVRRGVRLDKNQGNFITVVFNVMESMIENVTVKDLCHTLNIDLSDKFVFGFIH